MVETLLSMPDHGTNLDTANFSVSCTSYKMSTLNLREMIYPHLGKYITMAQLWNLNIRKAFVYLTDVRLCLLENVLTKAVCPRDCL